MHKPKVSFARRLRKQQTDAERRLWAILRNGQLSEVKFRRQEPIGRYIVDFVSFERKLIIELDGSQHAEAATTTADAHRTLWLESEGFQVLRFWDNEVLQNMDGVLTRIEEIANQRL